MSLKTNAKLGVDFFLLVLIITVGLGGVLLFNGHKSAQIFSVVTMCALYIFWGVYYHHGKHLTGKVIVEYTGVAILVATLMSVFLLRV